MPDLLLDVKRLEKQFRILNGIVHAVNDVSPALKKREIPGMAGESGCGRNVAMRSVFGLIINHPGKINVGEA